MAEGAVRAAEGLTDFRCVASKRWGLTNGLHVDTDQLRAARFGLMHAHVPGNALGPGSIVDGYEALPLLHGAGHFAGMPRRFCSTWA